MESLFLPNLVRDTVISSDGQQGDVGVSRFPGASPLVKAIYFSREFIPTYYIVVVVTIVVASRLHWHTKRSRQRRLHRFTNLDKSSTQTSSSSSSTLIEDQRSILKDGAITERSPLMENKAMSSTNTPYVTRLVSRLKSLLLHQPKPIPAITARANHLPSNGTMALVFLLLLVNLFYLLFDVSFSMSTGSAFILAGRAGLCFVVNLPVLYILGAKNNQPLKWLTGWTYEKLNLYHRRLGEWMTLLACIHFIVMIITWYGMIRPLGYGLAWFVSRNIVALGLSALTSYLVIWATSIGYVREKAYEFFLASHIVLQIAALVLLFFHHASSRPYVGLALAVWILDRGLSRILLSNRKFIATLEIGTDQETVFLYCDIPIDRSKNRDIRSGWKAGQHVFLSVPGIKWYHAFQAHPFTIGSPAPALGVDGTVCQMKLIIRAMDGFSKELLEYARLHQHTEVILDGPYGDSDLADNVLSADRVCLIAGGSGITLTYPLAWMLWTGNKDTPVVGNRTVYHNGRKQKMEVILHATPGEERQSHFWIRQSPEHASWINVFPGYHTGVLSSSETSHLSNGVNLVSKTFETRQGTGGRPDVATEIKAWIDHGDKSILGHGQRVCLVVCGPGSLVRDVRNCASELVKEGHNVELHVEKFGW